MSNHSKLAASGNDLLSSRFAALAVLVSFALATTLCAQSTKPWNNKGQAELPGAKIEFDNPKWDFGNIEQGAVAEHTFRYVNKGTKPLIVTEAKSSCGCTVPNFSKNPIKPGESGQIQVSFNSRGRRGKQHKTVTVKSNDPNQPVLQLQVSGLVDTPEAGELQISPMRLDFGLVEKTAFVEKELMVRNVGKKDLTIQGVTGAPTELNAFLDGQTVVKVGETRKLLVTLQPSERTKGGYYERSVTVRSNDPNKPTMRIPCVAYIRGERGGRLLSISGEIDVGTVSGAGEVLVKLPILNSGDAPLTIERVQIVGTGVQVADAKGMVIQPGDSGTIEVKSSAKLHAGTFRDRILIYASDDRINPQAPSHSLTIFGYVTTPQSGMAPPK